MWNGFNWLGRGPVEGSCEHGNKHSSSITERLSACQGRRCSTQTVNWGGNCHSILEHILPTHNCT